MARMFRLLGLIASILVLSLPAGSRAEGPRKSAATKEPAGYRQAIDTALQEVELGNFEEAREQFARAHALFPNARTLRGLGISEFELRHYVVAVEHLEQSLASAVKPLDGNLRRDTEALLTRAKSYTGEVELTLSPESAAVTVDGVRQLEPGAHSVRLDVGDHVLEARADGYASQRLGVTVHGGQHQQVSLQLASLAAAAAAPVGETSPAPAVAAEAPRSERVPVYKRWWLWTAVGAVVAAGVVVAVVMTTREDKTEYRGVASENTPPGAGLQPLVSF